MSHTEAKTSGSTSVYSVDYSDYVFLNNETLSKISFKFNLTNTQLVAGTGGSPFLSNPTISFTNPVTSQNYNSISLTEIQSKKSGDYITANINFYYRNYNNQKLEYYFTYNLFAYNGGYFPKNTAAKGQLFLKLKDIIITSPYSLNTIQSGITKAFKNGIDYTSSTSSTVVGNDGAENRKGIEDKAREMLQKTIPLGLFDALNPQLWCTETPTKYLNIKISFTDPTTKKLVTWPVWEIPVNFKLSKDYWNKSFYSRLALSAGKISNDNGTGLIDDAPDYTDTGQGEEHAYNGGTAIYHTTTALSFVELKENDNDDDYDSISVNGIQLNGINGNYSYTLTDNTVGQANGGSNESSTYVIALNHKVNPNIDGDVADTYNLTVIIRSKLPEYDVSLMNWSEKNPDYIKLCSPTIKDSTGKTITNPDYDAEIDINTGTKKQLIWVKQQSEFNFPLDPINNDGVSITSDNIEDYDVGYIAQGQVVSKGLSATWTQDANNEIESVKRYSMDSNLTLNKSNSFNIVQGSTSIQTTTGYYDFVQHSTAKNVKGDVFANFYTQKLVYIGDKSYDYFVNYVDNSVAENFFSTVHWDHLKNYMMYYRGWENASTQDFQELTQEDIIDYWQDYVSATKNQNIAPAPADTKLDLSSFAMPTIKLKEEDSTKIADEISSAINKNLINRLKAVGINQTPVFNTDYYLYVVDDDGKETKISTSNYEYLASFNKDEDRTINVVIKSTDLSTILRGESNAFKVKNMFNLDAFDLSSIEPLQYKNNFSQEEVNDFYTNWILKLVQNTIATNAKKDLSMGTDYEVSIEDFNGIPLSQDLNKLQQFISSEDNTRLIITVYALDDSNFAEGAFYITLVQDLNGETPAPIPDINNKSRSNSIIGKIFTTIAIIFSVLGILILFCLWRFRWTRHDATLNTSAMKINKTKNSGFKKIKKEKAKKDNEEHENWVKFAEENPDIYVEEVDGPWVEPEVELPKPKKDGKNNDSN